MIDLRSDTVTMPTKEMRQAMLSAQVGDDVYGDDPTMNRLEQVAAEMLGKESALFVPSGTMGNQLAIMTHTRRGDEIIVGENGHIVIHEVGAAAMLSGVFVRTVQSEDNILTREMIAKAIRPEDIHMPPTGLICLENPLAMGKVVDLEILKDIYELASSKEIPVHLDGARIFNASTALGVDVKAISQYADSVMFCLSKGLCAPVGSMLVGSEAFIKKARKNRKALGGGMRQVGFLAAAGLIALEKMSLRLQEDHENARYLAEELAKIPGVVVNMATVEINMVFFKWEASTAFKEQLPDILLKKGIKINGEEDGLFRFVTSYDVSRADIDQVLGILKELKQF